MPKARQIGRLAMRHEGSNWNAYYALQETMEGAIFLGSIRMMAVVDNPARKEAFMDMMRGVVTELIERETGGQVTWPDGPRPAPQHEKVGHG